MSNNINYEIKNNSGILKEKNQFKGINMSQLTDIIAYAKTSGAPEIATMLQEYYAKEKQRRSFGLTYEHHLPEVFEISHHKIRKGDIVSLRSERGKFAPTDSKRWLVTKVYNHEGEKVVDLQLSLIDGMLEQELLQGVSVDRLIKTVSQDEVIYPSLRSDGEVIGDVANSLYHSVICSENYDALRMLASTDLIGKVDCIYIDPPYNTGNKDWIYNNDYVDGSDEFRSSAFMNFLERRLKEAKTLLNPSDSVLIVTIDEKEYLNVGMLLRQMFPGAKIQMVSSVINPAGSSRNEEFSRSNEFIYVVMIGKSKPVRTSLSTDSRGSSISSRKSVQWSSLTRQGANGKQSARPNLHYPLWFDKKTGEFLYAGTPLSVKERDDICSNISSSDDVIPVFPGSLKNAKTWGLSNERIEDYVTRRYIKFGEPSVSKDGLYSRAVYYLTSGIIDLIEKEEIVWDEEMGDWKYVSERKFLPKTQWNIQSHNASDQGTKLINSLLGESRFDFPKSLYAVEDVLRFFVANKPNATIIDFFGGSGTTAHAVMRLNEQDGGNRRSITITNNEVSIKNNKKFSKQGLQSGDPEWEAYGVYEYATKPRITAAITGKTAKSNYTEDVQGYYKYNDFQDEYPIGDPIPKDKAKQYKDGMKQNVRFFYLDYLKYNDIYLGLSDNELYSIIWLEQGQKGEIPQDIDDFYIGHSYAILKKMSKVNEMLDKIDDNIRTIYVHGDEKTAQQIHKSVSPEIDVIPLWDLYIDRMKSQTIK